MKFRVRLDFKADAPISDVEKKLAGVMMIEWFRENSSQFFIVHHHLPHGNDHYHMYMDSPKCNSLPAMRMRIKRQFCPPKSTDYSVKQCDDDRVHEYLSYLFNTKHGNISVPVDGNIPVDWVERALSDAKQISDDYESTKKPKKQSGPTQYDMSDEVYDMIVQKYGKDKSVFQRMMAADEDNGASFNPWTTISESDLYEDCVRFAIQVCRKHRKGFDSYSIRKIVHPAYIRFSHCEKQFVSSMVQNFFRQ